jgi:[ribosomal protein S5]-alanine N-acetyltransferase
MGPFPIETPRLLLREFRRADEAAVHTYASDPEVTRYTSWGPNDSDQTRAVLEVWLAAQENWPRFAIPLAIELKAEQRLIGSSGFASIDPDTGTGIFGYVLQRDRWGRGYATEASQALLSFGFDTLGLHRIVATCDVENKASSRVLEKLHMRREGHFLKDAVKREEYRDSYLYALLEEEWTQMRADAK